MINQLKAELRKILSVRSSYVIMAISTFFVVLINFYVVGWHSTKLDVLSPSFLTNQDLQTISFIAIFPAIISILLVTHEFRYNTIDYSLTLSRSRSRVLLAKLLVVSFVSLILIAFFGAISPLLGILALHLNHVNFVHQHYAFGPMIWHILYYGWAYSIIALFLAFLIRNQIGSVVTLLIFPTIEGILSIWFKQNTVYLPFSALHKVLGAGQNVSSSTLSPSSAALVALGYLVILGGLSWILFIKRDSS